MSDELPITLERRHRTFWVGFVLTLLGCQIVLMLVMVAIAVSDRSFAIEPSYYQKGLDWNTTAAQLQTNARLGWSIDIALCDRVGLLGERTFRCTLTDSAGQPLDDAHIRIVAFPHARGSERTSTSLTAIGSGMYETTLQVTHQGIWEFRFVIERGETTFTTCKKISLPNKIRG